MDVQRRVRQGIKTDEMGKRMQRVRLTLGRLMVKRTCLRTMGRAVDDEDDDGDLGVPVNGVVDGDLCSSARVLPCSRRIRGRHSSWTSWNDARLPVATQTRTTMPAVAFGAPTLESGGGRERRLRDGEMKEGN